MIGKALAKMVLGLCLSFSFPSMHTVAVAAEAETKKTVNAFEFNKKDPIYITADWMEVDQAKSTIVYKGRVIAVQSDMTMRSDVLTAYYDPEMKQMKQVVLDGKVNETQGTRVATGDRAVFDDKAKTVTLTAGQHEEISFALLQRWI